MLTKQSYSWIHQKNLKGEDPSLALEDALISKHYYTLEANETILSLPKTLSKK